MLVLSLVFLVFLVFSEVDTGMSPGTRTLVDTADWSLWAAFAFEYLALLVTAPDRRRYARTHVLDLGGGAAHAAPAPAGRLSADVAPPAADQAGSLVPGSVEKSRTASFPARSRLQSASG